MPARGTTACTPRAGHYNASRALAYGGRTALALPSLATPHPASPHLAPSHLAEPCHVIWPNFVARQGLCPCQASSCPDIPSRDMPHPAEPCIVLCHTVPAKPRPNTPCTAMPRHIAPRPALPREVIGKCYPCRARTCQTSPCPTWPRIATPRPSPVFLRRATLPARSREKFGRR